MNSRAASPEQLEREIVETRAAIDHKLAQLQQLAPRRAAAHAASVMGTQGGLFARNLALTLRDNPVPVLLLGIGIAWLIIAGRSSRYATDAATLPDYAEPEPDYAAPEPAAAPPTAAALAAAEGSGQGVAAQAARGAEAPGAARPAERDEGAPERAAALR